MKLVTLAFEAGFEPFPTTHRGVGEEGDIGQEAQALLGPRNPYFNTEYRERWGIKVHRIESSPERLCIGMVESALPKGTKERRYRAVVFRCDGHVLHQTPNERGPLDIAAAAIDMRYWVTHIDEAKVFQALCLQSIRDANRQRHKAEKGLAALVSKQSP